MRKLFKTSYVNPFRTSNFELRTSQRGFTLLFAILVSGLLFAMGMAIANLALKEIILSSAGKQSEIAFFAADTGAECALYWDLRRVAFPDHQGPQPAAISCTGSTVTPTVTQASANRATVQFTLDTASYCAVVTVAKTRSPVAATVIESRGHNDPDCSGSARDNPARVERALRVRY